MKKIIPFKKELEFETSVKEITSISLEHTLDAVEEYLISGSFIVSGTYKVSETSINVENFEFTLPFDIALDNKYDTKNIELDIEDFYYEVKNNLLLVNIDLYIDGQILKEMLVEEPIINEDRVEEECPEGRCIDEEEINSIIKKKPELIDDLDLLDKVEEQKEEIVENTIINQNINIFDNIENKETFATYKVYIVKEDDTIDTILNNFNITKEVLEIYNNLTDIKPKDKLLIPLKK